MSISIEAAAIIAGIKARLQTHTVLRLSNWLAGTYYNEGWIEDNRKCLLPDLLEPLYDYIHHVHPSMLEHQKLFLYRETLQTIVYICTLTTQKELLEWIRGYNNLVIHRAYCSTLARENINSIN